MASRRLVRFAVVGAAVVVNPLFGIASGPSFGAAEMRTAIEGTWQVTVAGADGAEQVMRFTLAQGTEPGARTQERHASRAWVRAAEACGTRSLVRPAGACMDVTRMPLAVTRIEEAGMEQEAPGELVVEGTRFETGALEATVGGLRLAATVAPGGEIRSAASTGPDGKATPTKLVRVER